MILAWASPFKLCPIYIDLISINTISVYWGASENIGKYIHLQGINYNTNRHILYLQMFNFLLKNPLETSISETISLFFFSVSVNSTM